MDDNTISVLISSSPIPSHPSVEIIQQTLDSVRHHLPHSTIHIMADGVREEQKDRARAYWQYLGNLTTKIEVSRDRRILILPFLKFTHQARMTMKVLETINTPLILFLEHDTPLVEKPIDWDMLAAEIAKGNTNHVRMHYDEEIHPDHQHMMHGHLTPQLIKTTQYHNRPFLTNATWFEQVLAQNFNENSLTFIEDKIYSPISSAPWEEYRLTVYDPLGTGKEMKRSRDLNGRAEDPKFPMVF